MQRSVFLIVASLLLPLDSPSWRRKLLATTAVFALIANVASSLGTYPHSLAYFNEIAGGPFNGSVHLLDGNVDWGQNLLMLKAWYDSNPESRPFYLAYFGNASPQVAGIEAKPVPCGNAFGFRDETASNSPSRNQARDSGPAKLGITSVGTAATGWYAVSVNEYMGYKHIDGQADDYDWFRGLTPVACIGYSIRIFHVASGSSTPTSTFRETRKGPD